MTDPETYAERVSALDLKLGLLEQKRREHSIDAAAGSKSALQTIAAADAEHDKLCRERQTLTAALGLLEERARADQLSASAKEQADRRTRAASLARNIAAFNLQIDDGLEELAALLTKRFDAVRELSATNVVEQSLINKMLGRDPLTRALHAHRRDFKSDEISDFDLEAEIVQVLVAYFNALQRNGRFPDRSRHLAL